MGAIIIIILIASSIIGLIVKRKPVRTAGDKMGRQAVLSVFSVEEEKQYIEFEKLFREQQDDVKRVAEGLLNHNELVEKEYFIRFNEEWYLKNRSKHLLGILYDGDVFESDGNEEIIEILNENTDLKEVLNSIIDKGVIIQIVRYRTGDMWMLEFSIDTEFTPFITGNNGVLNAFVYCEDEECEKYGNRKIEDNWYLWISPAPE